MLASICCGESWTSRRLTSFEDQQCVRNCDDVDVDKRETFKQPVLQTAQMFIGEMGCWLVAKGTTRLSQRLTGSARPRGYTAVDTANEAETSIASTSPAVSVSPPTVAKDTALLSERLNGSVGSRGYAAVDVTAVDETALTSTGPAVSASPPTSLWRVQQPRPATRRFLLLTLPTLFDICGTTLMNAGLLFTAPSVYQMTRGLVVLFVGSFSAIFLRRRLRSAQRLGIIGVVLSVAIVGMNSVIHTDPPRGEIISGTRVSRGAPISSNVTHATIGILLIAGAQIFTASQLVVEEWILAGSPLQPVDVVGIEGILGIAFTTVIMAALCFTAGQTEASRLGALDIVEGWRQLTTVKSIWVSGIFITMSVGYAEASQLSLLYKLIDYQAL